MDIAILLKDNGINETISQGLMESTLSRNGVRRSRSSSSEILTTRVGRKKLHLRVACWNVRTLLQKGKFENVNYEMTRLGINVLGISETRWPGEDDYKSESYRIIHSGGGQ